MQAPTDPPTSVPTLPLTTNPPTDPPTLPPTTQPTTMNPLTPVSTFLAAAVPPTLAPTFNSSAICPVEEPDVDSSCSSLQEGVRCTYGDDCCGLAGVGEFFLDLSRVFKGTSDRDFVKRVTDALTRKATVENGKMSWVQAEHRTRPDELVAQTGYMQGAAGIGMFLLRLDAAERGTYGKVVFPDSPFGR